MMRGVSMFYVYLALSVAGAVIPLGCFLPWLGAHGLALPLLLHTAWATPVSAFAWADVLLSGGALLVFIAHEQRRARTPWAWLAVLALFTVGVSLALPLFLALRERARTARAIFA